jgi:hypothetical protein
VAAPAVDTDGGAAGAARHVAAGDADAGRGARQDAAADADAGGLLGWAWATVRRLAGGA